MSGKIFWNYRQGIGGLRWLDTLGPNNQNDTAVPAGVKVVGAYLSDEAVAAIKKYAEDNKDSLFGGNSLRSGAWSIKNEKDLQAWIQEQIAKDPSWIAEKVVTETNGNGEYKIQFNGTWGRKNGRPSQVPADLQGKVADSPTNGTWPDGPLKKDAKHVNFDFFYVGLAEDPGEIAINEPFRGNYWLGIMNQFDPTQSTGMNNEFDPRAFAFSKLAVTPGSAGARIFDFNFALYPDHLRFDVVDYNTTDNFAVPGDEVTTETSGLAWNPGYGQATYEIVWTDDAGNQIGEPCTGLQPDGVGKLPECKLKVPADLERNTTFTASLYNVDKDGNKYLLNADSFTAQVNTAAELEGSYKETFTQPGEEVKSEAPTFDKTSTKDKVETDKAPTGTSFAIDNKTLPEGWTATVDPETGVVTATSPADAAEGTTVSIPVIVTYPDKTMDVIQAKFTVGEPPVEAPTVNAGEDQTVVEHKDIKPIKPEVENLPEGGSIDVTVPENVDGLKVDETTGEVTGAPSITDWGKDEETRDVEIKVEVKDENGKVVATDTVTVTVQRDTDKDGTPDITDTDDDNDGFTDEQEKEAGTDPKDPDSKPQTPTESTADKLNPGTGTASGNPGDKAPVEQSGDKIPAGSTVVKDPAKDVTGTDADGKPVETVPDFSVEADKDGNITIDIPEDATPGDYTVPVEVTYPDGSKDNFDIKVSVTDPSSDAGKYDPAYDATDVKIGEKAQTNNPLAGTDAKLADKDAAVLDKAAVDKAKDWTFTTDADGVISAQAPTMEQLAEQFKGIQPSGDKLTVADVEKALADVAKPSIPVTITYADGSHEIAGADFVLKGKDGKDILDPNGDADGDGVTNKDEIEGGSNPFDENDKPAAPSEKPNWDNGTAKPGEETTLPNTGGAVEDGTKVDVEGPGKAEIDEDGNLVVTPNEDAKPGDKITVTVTDKDGNEIDKVEITVEDPNSAEKPNWDNGTAKPGEETTLPNTGGAVEDGTKVDVEGPGKAEIDEDGNLVVTPNEDAKPGDKITVTVTDKDDNEIDKVEITITEPGNGGSSDGKVDLGKCIPAA
ncbi:Rib/alpha-like domain-containing protein, partial [Corynebacterium sp.]|uniref:Rib/alpha-like domain-containing protein n=1 Tax=Corynebacterium sp. TaxID=1720 RepID=UPI0026DCBA71